MKSPATPGSSLLRSRALAKPRRAILDFTFLQTGFASPVQMLRLLACTKHEPDDKIFRRFALHIAFTAIDALACMFDPGRHIGVFYA